MNNFYEGKKILITGGTGSLGKAISGAVNFTDASGTTNGTVDTV